MSVEQYRHTYPEIIELRKQQGWPYDYAESLLAHGGIDIKCLGVVGGLAPRNAKP